MDISRLGEHNRHIEQHKFQAEIKPIDNYSDTPPSDAPDSVKFTPSHNDKVELSGKSSKQETDIARKIYDKLDAQSQDNVHRARANIKNGVYNLSNPEVTHKIVQGISGQEESTPVTQSRLDEIRNKVKNNQDVLNTISHRLYSSLRNL